MQKEMQNNLKGTNMIEIVRFLASQHLKGKEIIHN